MLQEFFYEIIGLIVILTALVIYFLRVKSKHQEQDDFENASQLNIKKPDDIQEINVEPPVIEEKAEEDDENDEEEPFMLGAEEGSFGNIESNPFEEEAKDSQTKTPKQYRLKGEVPPHGKISKDNFKEFAGVKLLIAEDNLINQKVINGLLSDSGIHITMADDGQVALDILKDNSDFDMVLMDAHMPRIDGFEATRAIRANPDYEHIVVVALSGDTAADDIKKMIDSGMQEHLEKPLRMEALYDVLYAYIKASTSNKNSDYVEVIMTNELNGDKGLAVCSGDDEFYKDILREFKENYSDSSKALSDLLQNGDVKNADKMLLDLIGIAANIGADNIKKIAQDLKEAIKDTEENSYVTIMDEYDKHLSALLRDIKDYL